MKESLRLLSQREHKVVIGRHGANMWLLVLVMVVTFMSIAFSNASMLFLDDKMNDPFTNWVNIELNDESRDKIKSSLDDEDICLHYGIRDYQMDNAFYEDIFSADCSDAMYLSCRFVESLDADIIHSVLASDNLVSDSAADFSKLSSKNLGVIVTLDNMEKLGYHRGNFPAYIMYKGYSDGAESIGVHLYGKFAPTPLPLLAVVKRLPMNFDMLASVELYNQLENPDQPFNFNYNIDYQRQLIFHVDASEVQSFEATIHDVLPNDVKTSAIVLPCNDRMERLVSWRGGTFYEIAPLGYNRCDSIPICQEVAQTITTAYRGKGVTRVYDYATTDYDLGYSRYLSVNFASLDSIRPFEQFMKNEFQLQVEMSQINSKENFNAVSIMASVLSWAMILFSIVCIILFIINMLQSYFQKVKRNIGTFKAFGISTRELTMVYMLIILAIVGGAIFVELFIAYVTELSMNMLGVLKEDKYSYFILWSAKTVVSIIVMLVSTVVTVFFSLRNLLKRTPGDLIYDR